MKRCFLVYACLFWLAAPAQEVPATTEQQLENTGDEDLEDDALLQQLAFYRKNPVNLNTAGAEELQALRVLSGLQIDVFLRYRNLFGKLVDVHELQAVPLFDVATIRRLLPFVVAGPTQTLRESLASRLRGGERYVLFRAARQLEKPKGYDTSLRNHYLGDCSRLLLAYRYQYKNLLYFGGLADKDAGEQFFKGAQRSGFDFYSVHLFARNLGKIRAIALGDYMVNLGQGLTQWQSLAFGKSADVLQIKRQSPVLLPYRSSGEFNFNRGAGLTLGLNNWELTAFASFKKFSGNLVIDSLERFSSFATSGYYRTPGEVADRYKLSDFSAGGNLTYQSGAFSAGLDAVMHRFSLPLAKSAEPYNYFAPGGNRVFNASLAYSYTFRNLHLFGEAAVDRKVNKAVLQGLLLSVSNDVDLAFLYRNLSPAYRVLFGNAFTENTLPTNEDGAYAGASVRPAAGWQLSAYADLYHFPFIKYRVSAPGRGSDYLLQVGYAPGKQTEFHLRFRSETKPVNEGGTALPIIYPFAVSRRNLRLNYAVQGKRGITVKGRTELVWVRKHEDNGQDGFLSFLEIAGRPWKKLEGNLRVQYFETGGYDSRIYAYESDVLYGYSIPAFYDKGFRCYLNAACKFTHSLTVWLRVAQTVYTNRDTVGSGLDELSGNRKTDVKLQLKFDL